jgi:hypothetical protein
MTGSFLVPPSPPGTDRVHPLAGFASVDESAELIRHWRYAVERMMRILGGWIALTPELSAKLLLGRHVWDNAQHADALGRRLPELRAPAQVSAPVNAAFVAFMDALEEPERPPQTVERLVGVYRVLKPHLVAVYEEHLGRVNAVYEPPTERLISRLVEDERRHVAAGSAIIQHLVTTAAVDARARAWQARLEGLLEAAGGVTGTGLPAPARLDAPPPARALSDDAREFIRLERALSHWPMPEALRSALEAFGDALVARDTAGVRRWLAPGAAGTGGTESALVRLEPREHRVVAFAKIGQKRVVKIRVEGAGGAATLLTRWGPAGDGWCAEVLDVTAVDLARPA